MCSSLYSSLCLSAPLLRLSPLVPVSPLLSRLLSALLFPMSALRAQSFCLCRGVLIRWAGRLQAMAVPDDGVTALMDITVGDTLFFNSHFCASTFIYGQ